MTDDAREIRIDIEVDGTPEEVWDAIASGPGITAWFVPAEVDGGEGGGMTLDFGKMGKEDARVAVWEPPHRFVYETTSDPGPLAYEFLVEARGQASCVVRFVNSGFRSGEAWDATFDGMSSGWPLFFENLRLYLAHFRGQPCSSIMLDARTAATPADTFATLVTALGIDGALTVGDRVSFTVGDSTVAGEVTWRTAGMVTILTESPGGGIAELSTDEWEGATVVSLYLYLYGADADARVAHARPAWEAWMASCFPDPASA